MPVKREGKKIVEVGSRKVVGRSKNVRTAKKAVIARNLAHARKVGKPGIPPPLKRKKRK